MRKKNNQKKRIPQNSANNRNKSDQKSNNNNNNDTRNKSRNNRDKKRSYSSNYKKKRFNSDVKVVSTNVNKDKNNNKNNNNENDKKNDKKSVETASKRNISAKETPRRKDSSPKRDHKRFNKRDRQRYSHDIKKKNNLKRRRRTIIPYAINKLMRKNCSICNKIIIDMVSAIEDSKNEKYYHFDCVMKNIRSEQKMGSHERLVYLGKGNFALIEDVYENGKKKFKITKNIPFIEVE